MTTPYIGEIQMFGFNFNPRSWAFCNGATIPISQNTALFSLLGVSFGGNGQTTFQLPNFAGRAGCAQGQGPGLSARVVGETFGSSAVTLSLNQTPQHSHFLNVYRQPDPSKRQAAPAAGSAFSTPNSSTTTAFAVPPTNTTFLPTMLSPFNGGGAPHNNEQPYLGVNFCIALSGIYPARN